MTPEQKRVLAKARARLRLQTPSRSAPLKPITLLHPLYKQVHDEHEWPQEDRDELRRQVRQIDAFHARIGALPDLEASTRAVVGRLGVPHQHEDHFSRAVRDILKDTIFFYFRFQTTFSTHGELDAYYREIDYRHSAGDVTSLETLVYLLCKPFADAIPPQSDKPIFITHLRHLLPPRLAQDFYQLIWYYRVTAVMLVRRRLKTNAKLAGASPKKVEFSDTPNFLTDDMTLDALLDGFEIRNLLDMQVPVGIPDQLRFAHAHIVGRTRSGKTTLLQHLIAHDLRTDATIFVIDPHRLLVPSLSQLDLKRKVVLVDPRNAPGINIFDVKRSNDPEERRETLSHVTQLLSYFFKDSKTDLYGKQIGVLRHLCRLILSRIDRHGPQTLMDLLHFLENPAPFKDDIARQPDAAQTFFKNFTAKTTEYKNTANEIIYRLDPLLSDEVFKEILSSKTTDLNIGAELDAGSLVLIDADDVYLGDEHAIYGKIFLALIMREARKRDPLRPQDHHPVFVYVDEAHNFLDEQASKMLTDIRKFSVGCVFAHQHLQQPGMTNDIKGALKGAATKFVGTGVNMDDARELAPDMGTKTTTDFLRELKDHHWAFHVQGMNSAVAVRTEKDPLAAFPKLHAPRTAPPRPSPPLSPPSSKPDEDVSDEW